MKILTFIRHGESIANSGGVTMAHDAIPLSELGKAQAQALAAVLDLQPSRIVVSEFLRTHQTALPFCDNVSMQPVIHSALNEFSCLDPALIQGMVGAQRRPMAEAYWQAAEETHQEQRKRTAEETHRVAERLTKIEADRDNAHKQAATAREEAAQLRGQLEATKAQAAELIQALSSHQSAKSTGAKKTTPN